LKDCASARGSTNLAIDGDIGGSRPLNLEFSLDADNLALLAEGARGELHSRGKIGGTSDAPVIKMSAQGSGIQTRVVRLDKLVANIDLDWRGQRTSHGDIAISGLKMDERTLSQFNASLDGTTADHVVRADALAGKTTLHLSGKGGFADGVWRGIIGDLFIDDSANINLQLDTPVKLMASAKSFRLESLCLHGKVARLCGEAAMDETGWNAHANAHDLPDRHASPPASTPNVVYQGTVNATASAGAIGGAPFVGEATR
jgi:autotransporter translocation and assembly factor TamB